MLLGFQKSEVRIGRLTVMNITFSFKIFVCLCVSVYAHMCNLSQKPEKALNTLKLELQAVRNLFIRVWRMNLRPLEGLLKCSLTIEPSFQPHK